MKESKISDNAFEMKKSKSVSESVLESVSKKKKNYTVKKGEENYIHLLLVQGRRFNASTGVEQSTPFVQIYTRNEWMLYKDHLSPLGYEIVEVLHDPFNIVKDYINAKII